MKTIISAASVTALFLATASPSFAHRKDPAEFFSLVDSDGSGTVSLSEFLAAPKVMSERKGKPLPPEDAERDAELSTKFKAAAGDDQALSLDEFKNLIHEIKPHHGKGKGREAPAN